MEKRANFETANASRYLGTLCKHFGHKVPTGQSGAKGWIDFPFARCELEASPTDLRLSVSAKAPVDLDKAQKVITSHLERFAFRENPELVWQASAGSTHPD